MTTITGYFRTEHFLYRQWDLGVSDNELNFVLNRIQVKKGHQLLLVSRNIKRKYCNKNFLELLIKIEGRTLTTCHFLDLLLNLKGYTCL
jgi:hypothetical protein